MMVSINWWPLCPRLCLLLGVLLSSRLLAEIDEDLLLKPMLIERRMLNVIGRLCALHELIELWLC